MIGKVVSCEDMLLSRELRARKQSKLLTMARCLVSFTMVMPGAVKCTELSIFGFEQGVTQIDMMLQRHDINVEHHEVQKKATGYEGYWLVKEDAAYIKSLTVQIEDNFQIGRVFDIDVIDSSLESVSRTSLSLDPRKCFICDALAHECSRSGRHDKAVVVEFVNQMLHDFKKRI